MIEGNIVTLTTNKMETKKGNLNFCCRSSKRRFLADKRRNCRLQYTLLAMKGVYAMPRRVRKSINCRVFLGYFTIAPLTWLQLCLLGFLSFFMCQVCLLHCPPSTICLKIIAAVVVVGGAAAVIALFSFLLLLLLSLYCAALCGIFCQVHIWDGSKRPKNNCAALIKKLNSAQGREA